MRFCSVGSGSAGNALLVEAGRTRVLLDCGFGLNEVCARLASRGWSPDTLAGIVVTHEHGDHIGGVDKLARKFSIPVFASHGTLSFLRDRLPSSLWREVHGDVPVDLGDLQLAPFPVPHDARQPLQYAFSDGRARLGVLTDVGRSTPHIEAMLSDCDALVLECNHDLAMLQGGPYPPSLKQRVAGPFGHLANATAAGLLGRLRRDRLQHVIAAHLSLQNNTPQLAREALAEPLGCSPDWVEVATQEQGFDWRTI